VAKGQKTTENIQSERHASTARAGDDERNEKMECDAV
jgi:hypothetical protein